ncbi:MAG: S49 family peptidase [Alysiella sp.]|uniref:S49 family peptidase n=1 Tax=Alysiella sp. TaxID=1872483 RepID=UPI0026DA7ECE|nr:S49 family peptidase [Alysiella sp.]MDO4434296.1 S49 family peptidase [Alysiella sp.]
MNYRIRRPDEHHQDPSPTFHEDKWAQHTLRDVLFEAYREQRRARLWRNIWRGAAFLVFLTIATGVLNSNRNSEKNEHQPFSSRKEHTAVINLTGVIGGDEHHDQVEILRKGMEAAYKNKNAKAIIIRANSPGGSPVVSNIAFGEIRRLKAQNQGIPVYVVAEDMCASGCYYIAAAADKIYADPSSLVGSIGVIGSGFDATGLMEKLGVKRRVRIAGNNKGMGDPFTPETPEQQAVWQQMLDQIHAEFIKAVREGRGSKLKENDNPDLFSGRIYTGIEAQKVGLIDDFGNVYTIARDVVQAPELVDYTPQDDDLLRLINRRFGVEISNAIQEKLNRIW